MAPNPDWERRGRTFLEVNMGSFKDEVLTWGVLKIDDLGKERNACIIHSWHEKNKKHSEKCNWLICLVQITFRGKKNK